MDLRPRRLDKFLSDATTLSLVQIRAAWAAGRVAVAREGADIEPWGLADLVFHGDTVLLDGRAVYLRGEHCHAILNKPPGVTSTARDPDGRADLRPWLAQMPPGMSAVGRLDRETTGLMLFTTDGDLQAAVLRPDQHTPKTYWLWLDEAVAAEDSRLARLTDGIVSAERRLNAEAVAITARSSDFTEVELTLTQGCHRQIRRMCHALGLRLVHLHRKAIGPIVLGFLEPGQWRLLTAVESADLWRVLGGPERQHREKTAALATQAARARAAGAPLARLEAWLACARNVGS